MFDCKFFKTTISFGLKASNVRVGKKSSSKKKAKKQRTLDPKITRPAQRTAVLFSTFPQKS
jgi:hypothetical protein